MKLEDFRQAIFRSSQFDEYEPAIALGEFGLIHASTLHYLRSAKTFGGRLFAAVLPIAPSRRSKDLLGGEERVRILEAFEIVSGAALIEKPGDLPGGPVRYFFNRYEQDISEELFEEFRIVKMELEALDIPGITPTSALLERMAAGR